VQSGIPVVAWRLLRAMGVDAQCALAIELSGMSFWTVLLDGYLGRARAYSGEEAASDAWDEGRRTRFEYAIVLAQDADGSPASPDQPTR
jgi:hypothetical protein